MSNAAEEELERQCQADLEKAIALSLEASELEKLRDEHRIRSISDWSGVSEPIGWRTDASDPYRPRPGRGRPTPNPNPHRPLTSDTNLPVYSHHQPAPVYAQVQKPPANLPPPPSQPGRKQSTTQVSDLISFNSPTKPDEQGLNSASNRFALYSDLNFLYEPSVSQNLPSPSLPLSSPLAIDCIKTEPSRPHSLANIFPNTSVSLDIGFRRDIGQRNAPFPKQTLAIADGKNHAPFPNQALAVADHAQWDTSQFLRAVGKRENNNLIDLSPGRLHVDDGSVLDTFDPLAPARTPTHPPTPPRVQTVPQPSRSHALDVESEPSIYDESDPFYYMYSPTSLDGSQGEPVYAAVEEKLPISELEVEKRDLTSQWIRSGLVFDSKRVVRPELQKASQVTVEQVQVWEGNAQLDAFCRMVTSLREEFVASDVSTNPGLVMAATVDCELRADDNIKLVVSAPDGRTITFTCGLCSSVEHVVAHVLCELELAEASAADFVLKVAEASEYLEGEASLGSFEYVHECIKVDRDVLLALVPASQVPRPLARTTRDDVTAVPIQPSELLAKEPLQPISFHTLTILLETMEREMERLTEAARQISLPGFAVVSRFSPVGVEQAVKALCSVMGQVETTDITEAVEHLMAQFDLAGPGKRKAVSVIEDHGHHSTVVLRSQEQAIANSLAAVRDAVHGLVESYSQAFNVDFRLAGRGEQNLGAESRSVVGVADPMLVCVAALHRPKLDWHFDSFMVEVQLYHGTRPLRAPYRSTQCPVKMSFYPRVPFLSWISINDIPLGALPRESRVVCVLYGLTLLPPEHDMSKLFPGVPQYEKSELGWSAVQCFNHERELTQGRLLLSLWPVVADKRMGPAPEPGSHPIASHPVLELLLPSYSPRLCFPLLDAATAAKADAPGADLASLDLNTQEQLLDVCLQGPFRSAAPDDREVLWEKRHYLVSIPEALPKILLAATAWDAASLPDLLSLMHRWTPMKPLDALQLLLPCFPDMEVRALAVTWLGSVGSDELVDYLPQLVQALKYEASDASALAHFLLKRALTSPRVAHHLFWCLVQILPGDSPQNATETWDGHEDEIAFYRYNRRLRILLRTLLVVAGEALRERFCSQQTLVKALYEAAIGLKEAKEAMRVKTLHSSLEMLHHDLVDRASGLPLSASVAVVGVQVRHCSYFPSKTLPLKLHFICEQHERIFPAIFKVGDDLQQDALTLQMIRVMDKLWLKEGLDLKMVTFACVPTGPMRGMIELVEGAETLRKIQTEHGLTGSFKDRPISEWLAKHNPGALEYERAVRNFTASCAGYSVATYVLGICDRHNDNIMLQTTGHLFHIDFGKFLGDAQMFGNFKRDRAPFVLTPDMAYVINGGDRPSQRFQLFVDLCCKAFAVVRQNNNVVLNLLGFMVSAGIPGVTLESMRYVETALLPGVSKAEAAASFSRLIQSALGSWFTQINFFLHNLSQLRASSDREAGDLLSFVPKRYTAKEDGRITSAQVHNVQKRYATEKQYFYVIRLEREGQPGSSYVFRTYREFCEFHQKICSLFPLAKFYSLPAGMQIGRSAIKQVAERRKQDIEKFLVSLFKMADETAHSDVVYTFFHPLLRDQDDISVDSRKVKESKRREPTSNLLTGQLKLTLNYQRGTFTCMVEHARDLPKTVSGQEPNTYVKVYLLPDPHKATKRKTKVVRRTCHPTFMEMLEYRLSLDRIQERTLHVTVWSYDSLQENEFLGGVQYGLEGLAQNKEVSEWFSLGLIPR